MTGIEREFKTLFQKHKAIITGDHFVYTPKEGKYFHGSDYVSKELLSRTSEVRNRVAEVIAVYCFERYNRKGVAINTVTGPELGVLLFLPSIADKLAELFKRETISVPCEKKDRDNPETEFFFRGIYQSDIRNKCVLVVEDVLTSGGSARRVIEAVRKLDGNVAGLVALCNRGGVTSETIGLGGAPIFSLVNIDMKMYPEEQCLICRQRGPESVRTDLGKGLDFLNRIGKS